VIDKNEFIKQAKAAYLARASNVETPIDGPVPLGDTPKIKKIRQNKMARWFEAYSAGNDVTIPEFPDFSGPTQRSVVSSL